MPVSTLPGRYALELAVTIAFVTMANEQNDNILEEFEREADTTSWNNISILTSSNAAFTLQIGKDNADSSKLVIGLSDYNSSLANIATTSGGKVSNLKVLLI